MMVMASGRLAAIAAMLMMLAGCVPFVGEYFIQFEGKIEDENGRPYDKCVLARLSTDGEVLDDYPVVGSRFSKGYVSGSYFQSSVLFEASCDGAAEKYRSKPVRLMGGVNDLGTFVLKRAPQ